MIVSQWLRIRTFTSGADGDLSAVERRTRLGF
jgi:hypothetical protein